MKILVVGSGGREHAFVDTLAREAPDATLLVAPGNPGMEPAARRVSIEARDVESLARLAAEEDVALTIVGPEAPLAAGIVDRFETAGLPIFGPSAAAARLESSKAFAKDLMRDRGVPTAAYATFRDAARALRHVKSHPEPLVVKASGLAAGKGAVVCDTRAEAAAAIESMMIEACFGEAGAEVVVEEFMEGIELSVFFIADGEDVVALPTSRDYKRAGEGDRGLNTGGMGAYAPASPGQPSFVEAVRDTVARPVLAAMAEAGTPYRGFLYAGLMLTDEGPKVVEFNCRLGDPETQVVLPLLASGLLDPLLRVARGGSLSGVRLDRAPGAALVTVMASEGYPGPSQLGRPIDIPEFDPDEVRVFHAGTRKREGRLVTAGGRVLGVTGFGRTLAEAAARSRAAVERIRFEGARWRGDIGWHELEAARVDPSARALLSV